MDNYRFDESAYQEILHDLNVLKAEVDGVPNYNDWFISNSFSDFGMSTYIEETYGPEFNNLNELASQIAENLTFLLEGDLSLATGREALAAQEQKLIDESGIDADLGGGSTTPGSKTGGDGKTPSTDLTPDDNPYEAIDEGGNKGNQVLYGVREDDTYKSGYNTGGYNTGGYNTGGYNTGGYNTGGYNTGGYNTGGYNTGGYNTGGYNTGGYNTGGYNTGGYNTGGYNTGGYNTGGYNTGGYNTGGYNTGGYNTGGYNTGGYNTGGYNTGGYNTGGYNTGGYNTGGYNTGGYNTGGYNTGGYNTGGYNTGGYNTGGYNTGGYNTGGYNPGTGKGNSTIGVGTTKGSNKTGSGKNAASSLKGAAGKKASNIIDAIEKGAARLAKGISPRFSGEDGSGISAAAIAGAGLAGAGVALGTGILVGKRFQTYTFTPEDWENVDEPTKEAILSDMRKAEFSESEIETFKNSTFKIRASELNEHTKKITKANEIDETLEEQLKAVYNYSLFDDENNIVRYFTFITMILDGKKATDDFNMYNILNPILGEEDEADFIYTGISMEEYIVDEDDEEDVKVEESGNESDDVKEGQSVDAVDKEWLTGIGLDNN